MSFTTVDKVKTRLQIPPSNDKFDELLDAIVDAVNCEILEWLNLTAVGPTVYEVKAGVDASFPLRNVRVDPRPVITVDAVTVYGTVLDVDVDVRLTAPDVIVFCHPSRCCNPGRRVLFHRGHDQGCRDIEATVTAGFAANNQKLKIICYQAGVMAAQMFKDDPDSHIKSKQIRSFRQTRFSRAEMSGNFPPGWPPGLQRALGPFLRIVHMNTATVQP